MHESRRFRDVVLLVLAVTVAGCVVSPARPLTDAAHDFGQAEDEKKLIRRSTELDDELRRKGLLLRDEQVVAYVNDVGSRVVPPAARGAVPFQFHVVRDPVINAFALPNGSIYLTIGLLARLENESQLAHVLSHETAHVVQRHGLLGLRNRKATVITAHIADLALLGTAIAYLPALGNLAAYSQESESEADRLAFQYMMAAGYSLAGADQLFTVLSEINRHESIWGSAYSSHPVSRTAPRQRGPSLPAAAWRRSPADESVSRSITRSASVYSSRISSSSSMFANTSSRPLPRSRH